MKLKIIIASLALTAALFITVSCGSDDSKSTTITYQITKFQYTTDGTTTHQAATAFRSELETACQTCEGKSTSEAKSIIDPVVNKYTTPDYAPYDMDITITDSNGGIISKKSSLDVKKPKEN